MVNKGSVLTTHDNPYNPIDQFEDWLNFDESHGYHTLALVARVLGPEVDEESLERKLARYEDAISDILENDLLGWYVLSEASADSSP